MCQCCANICMWLRMCILSSHWALLFGFSSRSRAKCHNKVKLKANRFSHVHTFILNTHFIALVNCSFYFHSNIFNLMKWNPFLPNTLYTISFLFRPFIHQKLPHFRIYILKRWFFFPLQLHYHHCQGEKKKARTQQPNIPRKMELIMF